MKKIIIIIFYFICIYLSSYSQSIYFNNVYDYYNGYEGAYSVIPVDNGYLISDIVNDSIFGYISLGILFIDTLGNEIWHKVYTSTGNYLYSGSSGSFVPTYDGGYALGGSIRYPNGDRDVMLWRFNKNCDTLWTKTYIDTSFFEYGNQCKQTPDGGYVIIGCTNKSGNYNILLIKTDSLGNFEWDQTYGGSNYDYGISIDLTTDGGYILGCRTASFGAGGYDSYIIKTDYAGNMQWSKTFGSIYDDCPAYIIQSSDTGYVFSSCYTVDEGGGGDPISKFYVVKLDSSGTKKWDKTYGPEYYWTNARVIRELTDKNFIISGIGFGTPLNFPLTKCGILLKINSLGDSLYYRNYARYGGQSDNCFYDVQYTDDKGFIVVGTTRPINISNNNRNTWVMKLDSLGLCDSSICYPELVSCKYLSIGSEIHIIANTDSGLTVYFSNDASQYVTQWYWDFGDGNTFLNSGSWINDSTAPNAIHTYDNAGNYLITLIVSDGICADTSLLVIAVNSNKINENTNTKIARLSNFPNPFSEYTTIEVYVPENINNAEIFIYNLLGIIVKKYKLKNGNNKLSVLNNDLPNACIYFYNIVIDKQIIEREKMIFIK